MSSRRSSGPTIDNLITNLLHEASCTYHDTLGLEWEWKHYNKIRTILQQIQEKESVRDSSDNDDYSNDVERRLAKLPAFLTWLDTNGINHEKVEVVPTPSTGSNKKGFDGFSLNTKVPLKAAELVFEVPEKLLITIKNARESKLEIIAKKDPLLRTMDNVLLSIYLLFEKYISGDGSFWKPYLDILPRTFDTILYFETYEMNFLRQSPNAFREALKMYRNIARQYAYFHSVFRRSNDSGSRALRNVFTYNRYIWAVSSVTTRQNLVPRPENMPDELSLVPLWDLCNHEESAQFSSDYNLEEQKLICYANRDYEQNEEFKIFYGHRTTIDFFIHGGFVPQSYTEDMYNLELGINKNDPNFERKKALLQTVRLEYHMAFAVKVDKLLVCRSLFVFIRIFLANAELLSTLESREKEIADSLVEPTEQVWSFLATRFLLLKKSLENNLAKVVKMVCEERAVLDEKQLSRRELMILELFKNEKKLLDLLATCCNEHLNQLKNMNNP